MKKVGLVAVALSALTSVGLASKVSAGLMLDNSYISGSVTPETIDVYTMTDFEFTFPVLSADTNSIDSPLGGTLYFRDKFDNSLDMSHSSANNNTSWWINGETGDYDIYTTHESLVTLIMPNNTRAFSFNVGADLVSTGLNAWLTATASDGLGLDTKQWFNVNETNTPGFGIYADNASCSSITSITIDPLLWGFGNFSINQDNCSAKVPEPSIIALFASGLFGLGFARRRMRS